MKYTIDHDIHIHSKLSLCSNDELQTPQSILQTAKNNGLKYICLTDHFWDESVNGASGWYKRQPYDHITPVLPLPQDENVKFFFGCETDLDRHLTLGLSREHFDRFDFVIIPTTHLHMDGFTINGFDARFLSRRAKLWVSRLNGVLDMDIPFEKVGIAHLACGLFAKKYGDESVKALKMIDKDDMKRCFAKAAEKGVGIELNISDFDNRTGDDLEAVLNIFRTAKEQGCRFYLGSDAHHPDGFDGYTEVFSSVIDALALTEDDKFIFPAAK